MCEVKPYVLRFWETEFEQISPELTDSGDKKYSSDDLEAIERIKDLLFNQKMSIPQAKVEMDKKFQEVEEELDLVDVAFDELKQEKEDAETQNNFEYSWDSKSYETQEPMVRPSSITYEKRVTTPVAEVAIASEVIEAAPIEKIVEKVVIEEKIVVEEKIEYVHSLTAENKSTLLCASDKLNMLLQSIDSLEEKMFN